MEPEVIRQMTQSVELESEMDVFDLSAPAATATLTTTTSLTSTTPSGSSMSNTVSTIRPPAHVPSAANMFNTVTHPNAAPEMNAALINAAPMNAAPMNAAPMNAAPMNAAPMNTAPMMNAVSEINSGSIFNSVTGHMMTTPPEMTINEQNDAAKSTTSNVNRNTYQPNWRGTSEVPVLTNGRWSGHPSSHQTSSRHVMTDQRIDVPGSSIMPSTAQMMIPAPSNSNFTTAANDSRNGNHQVVVFFKNL